MRHTNGHYCYYYYCEVVFVVNGIVCYFHELELTQCVPSEHQVCSLCVFNNYISTEVKIQFFA